MLITTITASHGVTIPHPTMSYASLRFDVTVAGTTDPRESPEAVGNDLQALVEELVNRRAAKVIEALKSGTALPQEVVVEAQQPAAAEVKAEAEKAETKPEAPAQAAEKPAAEVETDDDDGARLPRGKWGDKTYSSYRRGPASAYAAVEASLTSISADTSQVEFSKLVLEAEALQAWLEAAGRGDLATKLEDLLVTVVKAKSAPAKEPEAQPAAAPEPAKTNGAAAAAAEAPSIDSVRTLARRVIDNLGDVEGTKAVRGVLTDHGVPQIAALTGEGLASAHAALAKMLGH